MLSCDRIEPAKVIHSTLSLAKLVYYIIIISYLKPYSCVQIICIT